ncbi:MAG: hypothetical protein J7K73_00010 [Nanoarchaeota archaeon]|nr:hypothetical protein [Nanoarchaeota archaeon]
MVIPTTEFDSSRYYTAANLLIALLHDGPLSKDELADIVKGEVNVCTNEVLWIIHHLKARGYIKSDSSNDNLYLGHKLYN